MVELDGHVGQLLKKLDDLGIADNTIVVYTTDNGAEVMSWPDGGTTPFRGEKATNWEGGFRVPCVIRWPGVIKPGTVINDIVLALRLDPDLCRGGGEPDSSSKCSRATRSATRPSRSISTASTSCRSSRAKRRKRRARSSSTGATTASSVAIRVTTGRSSFSSRTTRASASGPGDSPTCACRSCSTCAADPFERGDESILYDKWMADQRLRPGADAGVAAQWLQSFKDYPAGQKPGELQLDAGDGMTAARQARRRNGLTAAIATAG